MAPQTKTQRQAAGKKAAATRKRNATKRSASATKASARRATGSASATTRSASRTGKQATRTAGRGIDAAAARLDAFATQAQRALLIQVGAAATLRDNLAQTAETYTNLDKVVRELDRFERRGERVLKRTQRTAKRNRRDVERDVRNAQDGVRQEATEVVDRIKNLWPERRLSARITGPSFRGRAFVCPRPASLTRWPGPDEFPHRTGAKTRHFAQFSVSGSRRLCYKCSVCSLHYEELSHGADY